LSNVDNTSDADKPVSTAQQTALDLKGDIDGQSFTNATINGLQTVASGTAPVDTSVRWYNTGDDLIYTYDGSNWVSEVEFSLEFTENGPVANGAFLFHGNTRTNQSSGPVIPADIKLTRYSFMRDAANNGTIEIYSGVVGVVGSNIDTVNVGFTQGGTIAPNNSALIPADQFISLQWSGASTADFISTLWYRRYAT